VESLHSVARRPFPDAPAQTTGRLVHTQADLRSPQARSALSNVDVCYHLGFQLWQERGGIAAMRAANLEGAANVVAARPRRVVLASSAAVYGAWPDNPLPIPETHVARPNPECSYAADKLAVERCCEQAAPTLSLRIAAVLGAGADRRVARSVRGYRLAVPAIRGVTQAVQFVDEDDVVAALVAGARSPATGVCNVATEDWLDAPSIARVSGGRVLALRRGLVLHSAEIGRRVGLSPFGADRAVLMAGPLALDPGLARRTLHWVPTRRSEEVLAAMVRPSQAAGTGRRLER
jgi:nucleoside-diphosphate-sugar epimerase